MARNVFYSFHYDNDAWRASQVRNMGVVDGNTPIRDNDWEEVKKGGDKAIEKWIDDQLSGRSCAVVLVGAETANRPWVIHEIARAWNLGKGVVGDRYGLIRSCTSSPIVWCPLFVDHHSQASSVVITPVNPLEFLLLISCL
jgi:hypothetical protein